ncbi:MAG: trypsin-like peptidase domain-containing protein [Clostridia bacterium]|nr:trypsin-like peptidase domain-containing protein [Clostridia bacterium]
MKMLVYVIVVVFVGLFAFSAGEDSAQIQEEIVAERTAVVNETAEAVKEESLPDVVERVLPTVVGVETTDSRSMGGTVRYGSGVIVSDMGYVITNQHVVGDNPKRIDITLYDSSIKEGVLCWSDKSLDVAVIKYEGIVPAVARMGEYTSVRVGEDVFAIGNPLSLQFERSVTKGIVSAINRTITIEDENTVIYMEDLIQTDASINPGNSGGPLMNSKGEVIGINTVRVNSAEGMGFAVPVNICESVIESLEATGKFETPYLGLFAYTARAAKYLKKDNTTREGLFVISLDLEGPAFQSGIKYGDMITHINSTSVTSMLALRRELFRHKAGDKVTLTVVSGRVKKDIEVVLGQMAKNYLGSEQ